MQLRIAIDYIEVRGGVKVMAEAFGRKLAAERSVIFMFQILVHLNVPLEVPHLFVDVPISLFEDPFFLPEGP